MAQGLEVFSIGNVIHVVGALGTSDVRSVLSEVYKTVYKRGYQDIVIDFSKCDAAFASSMLSLTAYIMKLRNNGVDADLVLPSNQQLRALFINANWGHMIAPRTCAESTFAGHVHVPAICYHDGKEQHDAVNRIMDIVLKALSGFSRAHLTAIDWSINEITDNVLNHSQSPIGGIVQISSFSRNRSAIEYVVCDGGVGIPQTLRASLTLSDDAAALDCAIREGVTRDKSVGQGNGLYGSWRVSQLSGGTFEIHSGYASLTSSPAQGLHIKKQPIPLPGTLVTSRINYDRPLILEEAMKFQGRVHMPEDYVSMRFEEDDENLTFDLCNESVGLGSRQSGRQVRRKMENLLEICSSRKIIIDCKSVPLVSSSFADEALGKLVLSMGQIDFQKRIEFRNVDKLVKDIINRAIDQRLNSISKQT